MGRGGVPCHVCQGPVVDGVLEDGRPRHHGCLPETQELVRVTMTLTRADVEVYRRLGAGNASEGARLAARVCKDMRREDLASA